MPKKIDISFFDSSPILDDNNKVNWITQQLFSQSLSESYDSIFQNHFNDSRLTTKSIVLEQVKFAEKSVALTRYLTISFPVSLWNKEIDISYFTNEFIDKFIKSFPQLVLHEIWNEVKDKQFTLGIGFVPVIIRTTSHPVQYGLEDSLRQQLRDDSFEVNITNRWLDSIYQMTIDVIDYFYKHKDDVNIINNSAILSNVGITENDLHEIELLKAKITELTIQNKDLIKRNNFMQVEIIDLSSEVKRLKQTVEESASKRETKLQREIKKEKQKCNHLSNVIKKLQYKNSELSKDLVYSADEILINHDEKIENAKEWYQKKVIGLDEYDYLYQKVQLLEKMWKLHLKLLKKVNSTQTSSISKELVHRFTEDIQIFLMRNEAISINERVKFRKFVPFIAPTVVLLQGDYENLVEKAAYYDILKSENELLESQL